MRSGWRTTARGTDLPGRVPSKRRPRGHSSTVCDGPPSDPDRDRTEAGHPPRRVRQASTLQLQGRAQPARWRLPGDLHHRAPRQGRRGKDRPPARCLRALARRPREDPASQPPEDVLVFGYDDRHGGDLGSTEVVRLGLHAESPPARKNRWN